MAIYVTTGNPKKLHKGIKDAINAGEIQTWKIDGNGLLTHCTSTDQWEREAWFGCILEENRIVFCINGREDRALTVPEYAIYHGRFVEMLLTHFDRDFSDIQVSPLIDSAYDRCPMNEI